MAVDINEIEYSDWVMRKVNQVHRCTIDEVFDAIENYDLAAWEEDPERGRRLLVRGRTADDRRLRIILYPIDEAAGTFRLGTAF